MTTTTPTTLPEPDRRIDVRGQVCPAPLVETRKALNALPIGGVLEVVGDHPASITEIPQALASTGDILLQALPSGVHKENPWRILVRRGGSLREVRLDVGAHTHAGGGAQ